MFIKHHHHNILKNRKKNNHKGNVKRKYVKMFFVKGGKIQLTSGKNIFKFKSFVVVII